MNMHAYTDICMYVCIHMCLCSKRHFMSTYFKYLGPFLLGVQSKLKQNIDISFTIMI